MIFSQVFMCLCAILCFVCASFTAHHFIWMYKEHKPSYKELLFHWGVMVLPQIVLAIYFFYNYINA